MVVLNVEGAHQDEQAKMQAVLIGILPRRAFEIDVFGHDAVVHNHTLSLD